MLLNPLEYHPQPAGVVSGHGSSKNHLGQSWTGSYTPTEALVVPTLNRELYSAHGHVSYFRLPSVPISNTGKDNSSPGEGLLLQL